MSKERKPASPKQVLSFMAGLAFAAGNTTMGRAYVDQLMAMFQFAGMHGAKQT